MMSKRIVSIGRYLGGKVRLARQILPYLQQKCSLYSEPMAGLYTLGLNLYHAPLRCGFELNLRTHNLLVQIRDNAADLIAAINASPRDPLTLDLCWLQADDPLEDARRYYWVSMATYNGGGTRWNSGVTKGRSRKCLRHRADHLWAVRDRLQGVDLFLGDGLEHIPALDTLGTLHYFDPTYHNSVRGAKDKRHADPQASLTRNQYAFETDQDRLLAVVSRMRGAVVVSGYPNLYYADALEGWKTVDIKALDASRQPRTERLWLNPQAWARLPQFQLELLQCCN
ncbi:MAG: hypothetical protein O3A14_09800 [Cyanobacteria bacterium]|nr:hypothetical protein [Cyanobacteriota bacterium]